LNYYQRFANWAARFLIRFKRIKEVRYTAEELNELIVDILPKAMAFDVPGGVAKLIVMTAKVTIGKDNQKGLSIGLLCSLEISSMNQQLYRAHLQGTVKAFPYYHQQGQTIRLKKASFTELTLVNDEYLLVSNTTNLIKSLTPNLLQGLVSATLGSAVDMMSVLSTPQVKGYLAMFTDGNKQKVLDFHRPQVQRSLKMLIDNGDLEYPLAQSDFEEKLFADMGREIEVDNHQLVFKF
jgi:hypothetical protein